jgi:predicted phage tail protein
MTEVRIRGYLSKFFDSKIKLHLGRLNDVFRAISALKSGFREKIIELQNKGFHYTYSIKNNIIDIFPVIAGFGKVFRWIAAAVLIIVGVILLIIPGFNFLGYMLLSTGLSLLMYQDPKMPSFKQAKINTGGATLQTKAASQSYIFSNKQNVASQGALIPIGYGEYLISSKIINVSVKNYPSSQTFVSENDSFINDLTFSFIL